MSPASPDPVCAAAVLSDRNPLVVSRQLLTAFANDIRRLPADVLKARALSVALCLGPPTR